MAGCATQTFTGITQARFDCLVQRVQATTGIAISGNAGSAGEDGVTIRWEFDPVGGTLELQCMSKPFIISCGTINGKIHDLVDACP
jgi:hypothetical protein